MRVLSLVCFITCFSFAQNKQLLYGFSEIPQALMLNPGTQVKNRGFFGIPMLSHIHFNAGTSGFSAYDIFADNGVDFNEKLENTIYNAKARNFVTITEQIEMLYGGFAFGNTFEKNEYLSFGLYQEFDFINYFPKDYTLLALEGNQNNINRVFNAGHLKASAEVISVLHVGYNKKVNNQLTYGIRGKIYSSILNASSVNNKGGFVTQLGENNIYKHTFNLDLELRTSGIESIAEGESEDVAKQLLKRTLMGGDKGLGFDVGFTYQINDQLHVDASLLDIGFIRHTSDNKNYSIKGSYVFEGLDPFFLELENGQTVDEYWTEIGEDFDEFVR